VASYCRGAKRSRCAFSPIMGSNGSSGLGRRIGSQILKVLAIFTEYLFDDFS